MNKVNDERTVNKELAHIIEHLENGDIVLALSLLKVLAKKELYKVRATDNKGR